jgi:hypothetical protein
MTADPMPGPATSVPYSRLRVASQQAGRRGEGLNRHSGQLLPASKTEKAAAFTVSSVCSLRTQRPSPARSIFRSTTLDCSARNVKLKPLKSEFTLPEKIEMAKNKQQKKKERERRVAQKKHAAAQKRDQDQSATETSKADRKTNIFTASVAVPKTNSLSTKTKQPFNYRRSGG